MKDKRYLKDMRMRLEKMGEGGSDKDVFKKQLDEYELKESLIEMNEGVHRFRMMTDRRYKIKYWIKSFFK
jgi:hypothetical protein